MGMELPTRAQLAQLASELYVDSDGNAVEIAYNEDKSGIKLKDEYKDGKEPLTLGYGHWSSEENGANYAYRRYFYTTGTDGSDIYWGYKYYSYSRAVCISN